MCEREAVGKRERSDETSLAQMLFYVSAARLLTETTCQTETSRLFEPIEASGCANSVRLSGRNAEFKLQMFGFFVAKRS